MSYCGVMRANLQQGKGRTSAVAIPHLMLAFLAGTSARSPVNPLRGHAPQVSGLGVIVSQLQASAHPSNNPSTHRVFSWLAST